MWRELEPAMGPWKRRQGVVGYVRVHAQQLCVQRVRDASGKRAAPAHGAHARVVGGGRPRTGTPSFKMGCKPPPAIAAADGETITRDACARGAAKNRQRFFSVRAFIKNST